MVATHDNSGKLGSGGVGLLRKGPLLICSVRTTERSKGFSYVRISASDRGCTRVTQRRKTSIPFLHSTTLTASATKA